jgi:hypothetical protein
MRTKQLLVLLACAAMVGGCATMTPHELTKARIAYERASKGEAAIGAPARRPRAARNPWPGVPRPARAPPG